MELLIVIILISSICLVYEYKIWKLEKIIKEREFKKFPCLQHIEPAPVPNDWDNEASINKRHIPDVPPEDRMNLGKSIKKELISKNEDFNATC